MDLTRVKENYASRSKEDLDLLLGELNGIRDEALPILMEEFKSREDEKGAQKVANFIDAKAAQGAKSLNAAQLEKIKRGKRFYLLGTIGLIVGILLTIVSATKGFVNPASIGLMIGGGIVIVLGSRLKDQATK